MKKLLKQLKEQIESLENEISKREDYYDTKSESWQNSVKGYEYDAKTDDIIDLLNSIEECIDNIETYLRI